MKTSVNTSLQNEISINFFPNPSTGYLNLNHNQPIQQLTIHDIQGRELRQIFQPSFPLNIEDLNSGMYVISVLIDKQVVTTKLMVL